MGKHNSSKFLKKTKARVEHQCVLCKNTISPETTYYKETIKDKFLHSLHAKKYCEDCVTKYKNQLPPLEK